MSTHRPDSDLITCPDCKHPVTMHAPGGICTGWQGSTSHPCNGVTDQQIETSRDQSSTPTRHIPGKQGNPITLALFDEWPDAAPTRWLPGPVTAADVERVIGPLDTTSGAALGPEWDDDGQCEPLTGTIAYAGALLDDDTIAELSETIGGDDALALWRQANQILGSVVIDGTITDQDRATIEQIQADRPAGEPFDPRIIQPSPRNAHDLQISANALRGAAALTDDDDVAEWLENIAQAFDTEREQIEHPTTATPNGEPS